MNFHKSLRSVTYRMWGGGLGRRTLCFFKKNQPSTQGQAGGWVPVGGEWVGGCSVGPSPKDAGLAELEVKSPSIGQTRFSGLETPGGATSRHFWRFRPSVGFHVFGPCPIGGGATERRRLGLFASLTPTARWLRGRLLVRGAVTVRLLPQDITCKF